MVCDEVARKKCPRSGERATSATCFSATRVTIRFYSVVAAALRPVNTFPQCRWPARPRPGTADPWSTRRMFEPTRAARSPIDGRPDGCRVRGRRTSESEAATSGLEDVPDHLWDDWRWQTRTRSGRSVSSVTSSPSPRMSWKHRRLEGDYNSPSRRTTSPSSTETPRPDPHSVGAVAAGAENPSGYELEDPLDEDKTRQFPG